jgi:hypothetical protein
MESEDVKKEEVAPAKKESAISINKEMLNQKLTALKEKNKELMLKVKVQADKLKEQAAKLKTQALELSERAGNSKLAVAGKSLMSKIKGVFNRVQVVPKKQVLVFDLGNGMNGAVCGFIFHNRSVGCVVVREARLVDFHIGAEYMTDLGAAGNPTFCRENILYMNDAPRFFGEEE